MNRTLYIQMRRLILVMMVQMQVLQGMSFTVRAPAVLRGHALAPRLALSQRGHARSAHPASNVKMGLFELANSFSWALIPGTVVAGILIKEGGFGAIGAYIDETFDYLEQKVPLPLSQFMLLPPPRPHVPC
jgi:predicted MFS family arabinose efflux permease